jgi:hypothetical protein
MDSTVQRAYMGSEIINENWVATDSEIINQPASTGDAWIRQRIQALGTLKSSTKRLPRVTNWFDSANTPFGLRNNQWKLSHYRLNNHQQNSYHGWRMDSTAQTALMALEIINQTASTCDAWIRQHKQPPLASEIINKTASTGDEWIRQRKKPIGA